MSFKERLKQKRKQKNLTQVDLAKLLGVSSRTVQHYEAGNYKPDTYEAYEKIAEVLDTTPEFLLHQDDLAIIRANETVPTTKYGQTGDAEIDNILNQTAAIFAGGRLKDSEKSNFLRIVGEILIDSSKDN